MCTDSCSTDTKTNPIRNVQIIQHIKRKFAAISKQLIGKMNFVLYLDDKQKTLSETEI